ncbi:hypothetical protein AB8U03_09550 [Clostridium sp. Mt-5]|uniref:Uncharacterized protein n=1 Tax=Clostridium moutaii TaxID=3240932 RepID=A0ABV4BUB9_9CLOT
MIRIWGKIIKNNKIVKDKVVEFTGSGNYQQDLKNSIIELCNKFDIEKPYWLPGNLDEYNKRSKTIFTQDNFMDEFPFDKFVIEELDSDNTK